MVKAKETDIVKVVTPELVKTATPEQLDQMRQSVGPIGDLFNIEGEEKTLYDVTAGVIGLQNKDYYSILERTNLTEVEVDTFADLMQLAEHGIGGPLDDANLHVAYWCVAKMRARVSRIGAGKGQSRQEFENIMTAWLRFIAQKEEAAKQKQQQMMGG